MHPASTTFVLGYHGCDARLAEAVFAGKSSLLASDNDYDWLGHGVYFWEHNAQRAFEFAAELRDHPRDGRKKIKRPAVVGAIIDLGFCLNLLDSQSIEMVRQAFNDVVLFHQEADKPLPSNRGGPDRVLRRLDCAVIETLHTTRADRGEPPFDTVRAAFIEGSPIYDDAGFNAKNHIQLCVRNVALASRDTFGRWTNEASRFHFLSHKSPSSKVEEMTMKQIGATLDLSESRVSQMHNSILAGLKAQMADRRKEFQ